MRAPSLTPAPQDDFIEVDELAEEADGFVVNYLRASAVKPEWFDILRRATVRVSRNHPRWTGARDAPEDAEAGVEWLVKLGKKKWRDANGLGPDNYFSVCAGHRLEDLPAGGVRVVGIYSVYAYT